jgi:hypothetical protein
MSVWPIWICRLVYVVPVSLSFGQTWPFPPDAWRAMFATLWAMATLIFVMSGELAIAYIVLAFQVVDSGRASEQKGAELRQLGSDAFTMLGRAVDTLRGALKALGNPRPQGGGDHAE